MDILVAALIGGYRYCRGSLAVDGFHRKGYSRLIMNSSRPGFNAISDKVGFLSLDLQMSAWQAREICEVAALYGTLAISTLKDGLTVPEESLPQRCKDWGCGGSAIDFLALASALLARAVDSLDNADTGLDAIFEERTKQLAKWPLEHDLEHPPLEIPIAATLYAAAAGEQLRGTSVAVSSQWPWQPEEWHLEEDPRDTIIKAGALFAAAVERELSVNPPLQNAA
jgi:hypothetical protein